MCWISSKTPVAKIAKRDKVVYKETWAALASEDSQFILSMWKRFKYKIGETYTLPTPLEIKKRPYNWSNFKISEGFHSYNSKKFILFTNLIIIKCIIPAGTKYYLNEMGDVVSESIKLIEILK